MPAQVKRSRDSLAGEKRKAHVWRARNLIPKSGPGPFFSASHLSLPNQMEEAFKCLRK